MNTESSDLKEKGNTGARRGGSGNKRKTTRVSLEEHRSKLNDIGNMDEGAFYYRWAFDDSDQGARIFELKKLGFEFADSREHDVPVIDTFESGGGDGSIIRRSNGKSGGYMYLMRQPIEFRNEDLAYKDKIAKQAIAGIRKPAGLEKDMAEGGIYGNIKIENQEIS